jgi:hypothetical protein
MFIQIMTILTPDSADSEEVLAEADSQEEAAVSEVEGLQAAGRERGGLVFRDSFSSC